MEPVFHSLAQIFRKAVQITMKKRLFCSVFALATAFTLQGCKPTTLDTEIYTSDLREAINGKSANASAIIIFSMLGDDKKNILDEVVSEVKEILPSNTRVSLSNGKIGKQIVIETNVPISSNTDIKSKSVVYFLLKKTLKVMHFLPFIQVKN